MIDIAFRGRIGGFPLDTNFTIPPRGVTALFGPSGCGKTTVLRCIAGLHRVENGLCKVDDDVWQDETTFVATHLRPIGFVFQEASLFAHLSVRRNLLYGAGPGPIGFDEVIDLLGLAALLDRAPHFLSGGERQRVAIGRALLTQPKLLLMDEPLSALDRLTKDEVLPFLERLHQRLALPVIYVTHDMAEVERLADHLVLMASGRAIATGPLAALQTDPTLPLVQSRSPAISLDAIVTAYDPTDGLATLSTEDARFLVPTAPIAIGSRSRLRILATDVSLALQRPDHTTITNILPAHIISATNTGEHEITIVLAIGPQTQILCRITQRSWRTLSLQEGMDVHAQIKAVALIPPAPV